VIIFFEGSLALSEFGRMILLIIKSYKNYIIKAAKTALLRTGEGFEVQLRFTKPLLIR
jgi:hypothetical protein